MGVGGRARDRRRDRPRSSARLDYWRGCSTQPNGRAKVVIPTDSAAADSLLASTPSSRVVNFCASWAEPLHRLQRLRSCRTRQRALYLTFIQLDADAFPDQCERFNLESVPAFYSSTAASSSTLLWAQTCRAVNKVKQHALSASIAAADEPAVDLSDAPASKAAKPSAPSLDDRLKA